MTEENHLAGLRVLVAGATGGCGKEVVKQLVDKDVPVKALVRNVKKAERLLPSKATIVKADIQDEGSLREAMTDVDAVVCALGPTNILNPRVPYLVDCKGVGNLVRAAKDAGVKKFVHVSSIGVLLEHFFFRWMIWGVLTYKRRGEDQIRASGIDYTILRPGGLIDAPRKPSEEGNVVLIKGEEMKYDGGIVLRSQVAACCVEALVEKGASNLTAVILSRHDAPERSFKELFEQ